MDFPSVLISLNIQQSDFIIGSYHKIDLAPEIGKDF